jgi:hypothetical protein
MSSFTAKAVASPRLLVTRTLTRWSRVSKCHASPQALGAPSGSGHVLGGDHEFGVKEILVVRPGFLFSSSSLCIEQEDIGSYMISSPPHSTTTFNQALRSTASINARKAVNPSSAPDILFSFDSSLTRATQEPQHDHRRYLRA